MTEKPDFEDLGSAEAVLQYVRSNADDIEAVVIPITSNVVRLGAPGRPGKMFPGAGAWIKLSSGESLVIAREAAEMLINDGLLKRLNVKCELDPLSES